MFFLLCESCWDFTQNILAIFGTIEKTIMPNSYENAYCISEKDKIVGSDDPGSIGELGNTGIIQQQIKLEPLDIKEEPLEADDDDDDEKSNSSLSNKQAEPETIQNKCFICNTILESRSRFRDHLESHKKMLPYKCSQCSTETNPIIYATVVFLNKHFESHGFSYVCPHCPLRYRTSGSLVYHRRTVHEQQVEYLGKTSEDEAELGATERIQNSNSQKHDNIVESGIHSDGNADFIQERIELEPVDIKNEPLQSDEEEMDEDELSQSYENENEKPGPPKRRGRRKKTSKVAQYIPNKCYICSIVLESKSSLNDHLESHKSMLPYKCSPCSTEAVPVKAYTVADLNKHLERHGFNFVCPQCPLRYRKNSTLEYHIRSIHGRQKLEYHCEICGEIFTKSQLYQCHINVHKNLMTQRYRCPACQETFSTKSAFQSHKNSSICEERKLQLETATEVRESQSSLPEGKSNITTVSLPENDYEKHATNRSNDPGAIVKLDPSCSEGNNVGNSIIHAQTVGFLQKQIEPDEINIKDEPFESDEDRTTDSYGNEDSNLSVPKKERKRKRQTVENKCYICDTVLESRSDFNDHLESHRNMIPYKCSQCSTEINPIIYTTVVLLNRHLESHGYNFVCPHCPLRYRENRLVINHIRMTHEKHTVEYDCQTCGKVFTNKNGFRTHILAHKNLMSRKYTCEPCQMHFSSRRNLVKHNKSHSKQQLALECKTAKNPQPATVPLEAGSKEKALEILEQNTNDTDKDPNSVAKTNPNDAEVVFSPDESENQSNDEKSKQNERRSEGQATQKHGDFKCETCGKVYHHKKQYRRHINSHTNVMIQRYKCEPCQKVFSYKPSLLKHKKSYMCARNTEKESKLKMITEEKS